MIKKNKAHINQIIRNKEISRDNKNANFKTILVFHKYQLKIRLIKMIIYNKTKNKIN